MQISTKSRYGLRLMIDLVMNGDKRGVVSLHQVAKRQALSEKYLWQIANRLKASGLINAISGAKGGYVLARSAESITMADIVESLEGNLNMAPCVKTSSVCSRGETCISREVWKEISVKITEIMKSMTLRDVLQKQLNMTASINSIYNI